MRLACPVSPSTGYAFEWPHRLTLYSPVWAPEPHGPSSTVFRWGDHTPAMLRALHRFGHEFARASPHILRVAIRDQSAGGLEPGVAVL